jgi:hypothetical protein
MRARVNTLLKEVLALEGPRRELQRAKARALAGLEASAIPRAFIESDRLRHAS